MRLNLNFSYDQQQDRLLLVVAGGRLQPAPSFWLTRNMVERLLVSASQFADQPTPNREIASAATRYAAATTAPRPVLSPIAALDANSPLTSSDATALDANQKPALVRQVKLARRGEGIFLSITRPDDKPLTLPLTDGDLLRLLDLLYRKSVEANWRLEETIPSLKESYFGAQAEARRSALN